jgi:hypothetical protein
MDRNNRSDVDALIEVELHPFSYLYYIRHLLVAWKHMQVDEVQADSEGKSRK